MKILALHGFTGSGRDFDPLRDAVQLDLVTPDLLGHGDEDAPTDVADYRIDRVAERISAGHDGEPVVLLGYSMGGRVALRLWSLLGRSLRGLVLVSVNPGIEDTVQRIERMATDRALSGQIEERGMSWFCEHWAGLPAIQSQRRIAPEVLAAMGARRARNRAHGLANSLCGMGQGAVNPVWDQLADIPVPTLLITGHEDTTYTAIARRMQSEIPRCQHDTVPGAGHCAHLEDPESAAAFINRFTDQLTE
jgi:2-succinyl-6-hydroxy-2,4-cyclohexadiene-1-carboxylate synthase